MSDKRTLLILSVLLLTLSACEMDVASEYRYDPREDVILDDREGELEAFEFVTDYYRENAPGYETLEMAADVKWVAGVPCDTSPDNPNMYIDSGNKCSSGITYSCDSIFIVLNEKTLGESAYAHELAHCASVRMGNGMDVGHKGKIWGYAQSAQLEMIWTERGLYGR